MTNKIIAPEYVVLMAIQKVIDMADGDDIAKLAGELLGGKCKCIPHERKNVNGSVDITYEYEFEPNENYAGAFKALV